MLNKNGNSQSVREAWYDFTGPLWEDYWKRTRKTVKFPRGYKEVSSVR